VSRIAANRTASPERNTMTTRAILPLLAALTLAACNADDTGGDVSRAPSLQEQACLAAVSNTTNNGEVTVLENIYSEANSDVTIGVGPDRAPWRCLVSNDGVVAQVMSLTNEGTL
jgi:hypothetical protein